MLKNGAMLNCAHFTLVAHDYELCSILIRRSLTVATGSPWAYGPCVNRANI